MSTVKVCGRLYDTGPNSKIDDLVEQLDNCSSPSRYTWLRDKIDELYAYKNACYLGGYEPFCIN